MGSKKVSAKFPLMFCPGAEQDWGRAFDARGWRDKVGAPLGGTSSMPPRWGATSGAKHKAPPSLFSAPERSSVGERPGTEPERSALFGRGGAWGGALRTR